jgi:PAS domain S-box-containing protein
VPTYGRVRYAQVYYGVDLVYYGNQRQLEYDFVVAPYTDPSKIRLRFAGARRLRLMPGGELEVFGSHGQIAFHKPVLYQEINGRRQPVKGSLILADKCTVQFRVGRYDANQLLTIDPVLVYSTYLGGALGNQSNANAVDSSGNAYVTGRTSSTDFPVTGGQMAVALRDGLGAINVVQDIKPVHETEEIFSAIFQHAAIGIAFLNGDGSVREVNPFFCQMLGYGREEIIGRHFRDFGHLDDYAAAEAGLASLNQSGDSPRHYSAERRYLGKDGHIVTGHITAAGTTDPSDRITLIVTIEDITRERAAQQSLARSKTFLKGLSESQLVGIAVWDEQSGLLEEANDTYLRILGYTREDLDNEILNWKTYTAPEHLELKSKAIARMRETGCCPPFEKEDIRKDGSRVTVLVGFAATDDPGKAMSWALDVSRQKELEKQLLQTQKMEAVGQLAGGIAHDFNNLLMIIGAHAELLALEGPSRETQAKHVGRIQSATKQASQLTRKLLGFSRKQELAATNFGIGQLGQEAVELVSPTLPKNVKVTFRRGAECWVRADYGQLQQVVVNLVLNARDALPHGGRIVIETSGIVVNDVEVGLHDTVPAGEYALLKIADTGGGIPPENIHRIFDPFFTTKPRDRGTGLGLTMVHGTVTQSGGHIRVKSSPGMGTTFCVYLPAISHLATKETTL